MRAFFWGVVCQKSFCGRQSYILRFTILNCVGADAEPTAPRRLMPLTGLAQEARGRGLFYGCVTCWIFHRTTYSKRFLHFKGILINSMPAGAPQGNKNGSKSRMFEQALIRAIKQRDLKDGEGETLRKIAEGLLDRAMAQDLTAIKETRDTLDGKPAQAITGADGGALVVMFGKGDDSIL